MKKSVYLLAGGRPKNRKSGKSLLSLVIEENEINSPVVAYIGTANGDDPGFFSGMKEELLQAGAGVVTHALINSAGADIESASDILRNADMIFVAGGDVDSGMDRLQKSGLIPLLEDLFEQGKTFFGISAGSIMLADRWVKWPDPDDADSAELFSCLGFAPVICDCHDEASGWEELQAELKLETEHTFGYGLPTGSGIRVDADGSVTVLGAAVHYLFKKDGKIVRGTDLLPG